MSNTTWLVTGANRGIGLGLVGRLIERPNTTVIATVRNVSKASNLKALPAASGSKVIVVKVDSTEPSTTVSAVEELQKSHGIQAIDVVVANAGICDINARAEITPVSELERHFAVNVSGPLALFQATLPLLKKGTTPKFVGISTLGGSIGDMGKYPLAITAYGTSKAAFNYVLRKIHFENPDLIVFPISPGWVATDMGNEGARNNGMEEAPVKLEDSVEGILNRVDEATREETSGTFRDFQQDGLLPW